MPFYNNLVIHILRHCLFLIFLCPIVSQSELIDPENQIPRVSNVTAKQIGLNEVSVSYTAMDQNGDQLTISMIVITKDGKQVFPKQLSGDVGLAVMSGKQKKILWTITDEIPLYHFSDGYVVEIVADDQHQPTTKIHWQPDDAEMVLVPAGTFLMGSEEMQHAQPIHEVEISDFYMDTYEVTVGQYRRFTDLTGYEYNDWAEVANFSPTEQHPMIFVTWYDAMAYCVWAKKRLPTEAEWEYAARGGLARRSYPWGSIINQQQANYTDFDNDANRLLQSVGNFPANGYGLHDLSGNVFEWCLDTFDDKFYQNSRQKDPLAGSLSLVELTKNFGTVLSGRVLRGGSYRYSAEYVRVDYRDYANPDHRFDAGGFRCVVNVPK